MTMYVAIYLLIQEVVLRCIRPYVEGFDYTDKFYFAIEVGVMCLLFVIAKAKKVNIPETIRMQKITPKVAFISVLLGCGMASLTSTVWYITGAKGFKIEYQGLGLVFFLVYHIWNSFYKEVYFRGCLFKTLNSKWSLWVSILIQGLIYGILFMGFNIPLIICGYFGVIIFTLMYKWVDSIWAGVIAQFVSSMLIYLLHSDVISVINAQTTFVFIFLGIALLVYGLGWLRRGYEEVVPLAQKTKDKLEALSITSITVIVLMIAYYIIYRIHDVLWNTVEGYEAFMQGNGNIFVAVYCSLAVAALALIFKKLRGNIAKEWCIRPISVRNVLLITIIAAGISVFTTCLTSIRIVKEMFPVFEEYMNAFMNDMPSLGLQVLCILLIPFLEEVLFRGIIFHQVSQKVNWVWGMVLSIGIYACLQGNLWIGLYAILGSIVYTLCFIWTKSLWGAVLVQVISAIFMLVIRRTTLVHLFAALSDGVLMVLCVAGGVSVVAAFIGLIVQFKKSSAPTKVKTNQAVEAMR